MVRAWIMDDNEDDKRLEHHRNPPEFVSLEDIKSKTGVLYCKLDPELEKDRFEELRKSREYSYSDVVEISPDKMPNYKEMITNFYKEHLHTDEEIRYVLAGSGYLDVRYPTDDWVRIEMEVGDLIVLPAGIYHRFTLDSKNYIKAMRLFKGEPVWTAHYKPSDEMDIRKCYAEQLEKGFGKIPDLL